MRLCLMFEALAHAVGVSSFAAFRPFDGFTIIRHGHSFALASAPCRTGFVNGDKRWKYFVSTVSLLQILIEFGSIVNFHLPAYQRYSL